MEGDLKLNIYPIKHQGKPLLLFKCYVQDSERVKEILKKVFSDEQILSTVEIKNKFKAIPKLIELELLKREDLEQDQLFKELVKEK
jgi:hypothetical protein